MTALDQFLDRLSRAGIGRTFNQFRQVGRDDVPDAPALRLSNLRHYLIQRERARIVAVGEAAGYQGMRWSGIAFTSERDLLRWGDPFRPTCRVRTWSEPSGTIVHALLDKLGAERQVVVWNVVPTHPRHPGRPLSNRRPTAGEINAGTAFTEQLLEILEPRIVIAVGRVAIGVLGDRAQYVRHPANAGATAFRRAMAEILTRELA